MTNFTEVSNPWNEFILPDGRKMRVRHILSDVTQTGIDPNGLPIYQVTFNPVINIEQTPEQLAKLKQQPGYIEPQSDALTQFEQLRKWDIQ